jgi:hypothetical protein
MATCSVTTLQTEACASGFACLDEKIYRAVLLQLLCNISDGGGSAGLAQSFAGSGPPTTQVPAFNAGTYYDYTGQIVYHWNPTTPGWE